MVQAIENHGVMFRAPRIRREAMRKDGANPARDGATRQLPSFPTRLTRQKAPQGERFCFVNKPLKSIKTVT
jgi:hypothetical protein